MVNPYLLNQNFLDPAQYEPGGWLYENHSRDSGATVVNENGNVVWAPENRWPEDPSSIRLDITTRTTDSPLAGAPVQEWVVTGVGAVYIFETLSVTPGITYDVRCFVRRTDGGAGNTSEDRFLINDFAAGESSAGVYLTTGDAVGPDGAVFANTAWTDVGDGWWEFVTEWTPTSASSRLEFRIFSADPGHTYELCGEQVSAAEITESWIGYDVFAPRLQHDKDGNPLGYLHEPQATNLLTESDDFSAWTGPDFTQSTGSTSPDGSTASVRITETASLASFEFYLAATFSTGNNVFSIYAKQNAGSRYLQLRPLGIGIGKAFATFNLAIGTVQATGGTEFVDADIEDVGGGWYRCWMSGNYVSAPTGMVTGHSNDGTEQPTYLGGTGNSTDIWGAQAETGTAPTSYIPTNGASVTRQADSLDPHTLTQAITEGTLIVSSRFDPNQPQDNKNTGVGTLYLAADANNENVNIYTRTARSDKFTCSVETGGVPSTQEPTSPAPDGVSFYITGLTWGGTNAFAVDGVLGAEPDEAQNPPSVDTLQLFQSFATFQSPIGILQSVRLLSRNVSDADLQTLTS